MNSGRGVTRISRGESSVGVGKKAMPMFSKHLATTIFAFISIITNQGAPVHEDTPATQISLETTVFGEKRRLVVGEASEFLLPSGGMVHDAALGHELTARIEPVGITLRLERDTSAFSSNYVELRKRPGGGLEYVRVGPPQCFYIGTVHEHDEALVGRALLSACGKMHVALVFDSQERLDFEFRGGRHVPVNSSASNAVDVGSDIVDEISSMSVVRRPQLKRGLRRRLVQASVKRAACLVVNDQARYEQLGDEVEAETAMIWNAVFDLYAAGGFDFDVQPVLVGQVTWNSDEIAIPKIHDGEVAHVQLLKNFRSWFASNRNLLAEIVQEDIDDAQLFSGHDFQGGVVGAAYTGSLCTLYACGVDMVRPDLYSHEVIARIVTHELGHNFNLRHTSTGIMKGDASGDYFSDESRASLNTYLSENVLTCLDDIPDRLCGNGTTGPDQDCDDVQHAGEPCCKRDCELSHLPDCVMVGDVDANETVALATCNEADLGTVEVRQMTASDGTNLCAGVVTPVGGATIAFNEFQPFLLETSGFFQRSGGTDVVFGDIIGEMKTTVRYTTDKSGRVSVKLRQNGSIDGKFQFLFDTMDTAKRFGSCLSNLLPTFQAFGGDAALCTNFP